jgi:hypothetical protein
MKGRIMHTLSLVKRLGGLFVLLLLGLTFALPANAAPATLVASGRHSPNRCVPHKYIDNWSNRRAIEARGFNFDLVGPQASATFGRNLGLNLASNPASSAYTASRITEIESELPIAQRVKCWQATAKKDVVVEFKVRFKQSAAPAGMTENLILWNAPLPFYDGTNPPAEPAGLLTEIGVARTSALGTPQYIAVVAQDLDTATFNGLMRVMPMPAWLDAGEWHRVRLTLSLKSARIEVAQGQHKFTPVLEADLLHPAEPLGFEFSVDNEAFPGYYVPVNMPDGLLVDYLKIDMVRSR